MTIPAKNFYGLRLLFAKILLTKAQWTSAGNCFPVDYRALFEQYTHRIMNGDQYGHPASTIAPPLRPLRLKCAAAACRAAPTTVIHFLWLIATLGAFAGKVS